MIHLLGASLKLLTLSTGIIGSSGRNALAYLTFTYVKKKNVTVLWCKLRICWRILRRKKVLSHFKPEKNTAVIYHDILTLGKVCLKYSCKLQEYFYNTVICPCKLNIQGIHSNAMVTTTVKLFYNTYNDFTYYNFTYFDFTCNKVAYNDNTCNT